MNAFFKYINSCLDQHFYTAKDLSDSFEAFSKLFYLFTKEGYIAFDEPSLFYYNYILVLKDNLKDPGLSLLIKIIWSLMATNDESQQNPMIPFLFKKLKEINQKV